MEELKEKEKIFMNIFSNSNIANYGLASLIELPICDKFLTNEIGIKYIGTMLRDIDIRLYLVYSKMLKDNIKFIDNYNVENSVCISQVSYGITKNVEINVPNIKNGLDILAMSHELGHGLKAFSKVNNERHLHSDTIFDETISILFGKICLDRYNNDFEYDIYAQQFETINIKNAINCLNKIKLLLPEYTKKQTALNGMKPKIKNNPKYDDYKFRSFVAEVEKLRKELYTLISYPIGISLANVYDNFDDCQKKEYLEFVSKYILNIKHINFQMILDYFDISFNSEFYIYNFKEYISKFEEQNNKILVLRGKK